MKYAINLFPRQKSDVVERSVYFIANYLRYALVLSLLVVIVIFFLRISLDQQLIDEKEKLSLKQSIVTATKDLQADLNAAQFKIKTVQSLITSQDLFISKFEYINKVIPRQAIITKLTIEEKQIILDGTCKDYQLIQAFVAKLREDGKFEKVTLSKISRSTDEYLFSIELDGYNQIVEKQANT
jgi:Tfp pilus assembly protein PilN